MFPNEKEDAMKLPWLVRSLPNRAVALALAIWATCPAHADDPVFDPLWAQAIAFEEQGLYADAILVYESILQVEPDSQRAAVMVSVDLVRSGDAAAALGRIDAAVDINPYGREWAEWGYLYKAKICQVLGCTTDANQAIAILKDRFPDSVRTTEAEIVEAELAGTNTQALLNVLSDELEAEALHKRGLVAIENGDPSGALQFFDQVVLDYATTRQALRSLESKALALEKLGRTDEAKATFITILAALQNGSPQARLRNVVELHLASLDRNGEMRAEAYVRYRALADSADDPLTSSTAAVEAGAVKLEMLQIKRIASENVAAADWNAVQALLSRVDTISRVSPEILAKAGLKLVETLAWQGQSRRTIRAANIYFATVDTVKFKREAATVRFLAGEELQRLGRYTEALSFMREIDKGFPGNNEIGAGGEHLARVRFRIWEILRLLGASQTEIDDAANALLDSFPKSSYAEYIRIVLRQEAE